MKKRVFAVCFAMAMIWGIPGTATATAYSEEHVIPVSTYHDDDLDIDPVDNSAGFLPWSASRNSIPAAYVSPCVTSVKNQNPYGTCWAFAFISASEASLVQEELAVLEGENAIDLSELHLAYFMSHSVTDSLGGTAGDGFYLTDTSTNSFLKAGGNQTYATCCVANWYGLVKENVAAYDSIVEDEAVVLSDDIAYAADSYHLENSYWISMQDRETVKKLIMEYGACAASYYDDSAYYSESYSWYLDEALAAYCPENLDTNHGITIVGWDDAYSADNFGTYKPSSDGAWYCKNSWGTNWSKDGYFWISYEDVPLCDSEAFFYDYGTADNYDKNYQYDGGAMSASYPCDYGANIFTAQEDEYIKAVGFYTRNSNVNCTVKVYKNCSEKNPASGTLLATVDIAQPYAGFHTVDLGDSYLLKQGEKFSVVVYQTTSDGSTVGVLVDINSSQTNSWCSNTSTATEGQSFISASGTTWQDASAEGNNCRIKAYTDVRVPVTELSLDKESITLHTGETDALHATIAPDYATKQSVTWSSDDEEIVTVDEDGVVTAKKAGQATITCTSDDDNTIQAKCIVTVHQWVEQVKLGWKSKEMMNGDKTTATAIIYPENATNQTLQWTSSNVDVATVSDTGEITAVGYGTADITCTATDQGTQSAACTVTVYEKVTKISFRSTEVTLEQNQTLQLQATVSPDVKRTKGIYWLSSNPEIVAVDENGWLTGKAAKGSAVVSCIAKDGTGVKATCNVSIKQPVEENPVVVPEKGTTWKDSASNVEYTVITSSTTGGTVELTKGADCSGAFTIPETVTVEGITYKVVTIAPGAFQGNKKLTKLVIKNNITSIGKNAFYGCSKLTAVTIGKNVTTIGENAFYNCQKLKTVSMGSNIKTIGNKAFYQCSKLTKLVIPAKVTQIGKQAFYKCKSLKTITIKTAKLTKKKVGSNAFKGIHSKATIKVPGKKLASYKSILKARGIGNKVKVKKY